MAKGQLRSNREKKKPKQSASAPMKQAAPSTAPARPAMPALVKRERRAKD